MSKDVVRLNLRISPEDAERLQAIAEKKRNTVPAVVKEAIGKALDLGILG